MALSAPVPDDIESQTSHSTHSDSSPGSKRRDRHKASSGQDDVESQTSQTPSTYFTANSDCEVNSHRGLAGKSAPDASMRRGVALEKIFGTLADKVTKRMREKEVRAYAEVCSFEGLLVQGVTSPDCRTINGIYVPAGTEYNGKALFRKRGDPEIWLRFVRVKGKNNWMVSNTADKESLSDRGVMFCHEKNLSDPADATTWSVWTGRRWEVQSRVVVQHHSRGCDWVEDFAALCQQRGYSTEAGLSLAEFVELVSNPESPGHASDEDLEEALLRLELPTVLADAKEARRLAWIHDLFKLLDTRGTGRLDEAGLKHYAELCGFEGSAADWNEEYRSQCSKNKWDPAVGVDAAQFAQLVNDAAGEGYCTDTELSSLVVYVAQKRAKALPK